MSKETSFISTLAARERYRDHYWRKRDPIADDRLLWRAQTFRHTVHLLPGQTILELGCGELRLTRALLRVSRGENPITAVTFQTSVPNASRVDGNVEVLQVSELPGQLAGRRFDCIVAMDLLDRSNSSELLGIVHELLTPAGEMVFYESNPWNPMHKLRGLFLRLTGKKDPRNLLNRPDLYELLSELGFVRIYAVFNDFVFAPLTRPLIWFLRNLSILLENAPVVRRLAGSILIHAQKPPRQKELPAVSLFAHESLRSAVSVVIPSHNEEMNIAPLVQRILSLYGEYIHEIIPVNDGSTDRTAEVMTELAAQDDRVKPLHRVPPNGVGLAIADGLAAATGRYVLTMDCDFQHLLPEFRDLLDRAAEGYDVVIGSRFSRHSVLLNYPFLKIFANRAFHAIAVVLFGRRIRDVTNNLKIMRREVVQDLRLRQRGFAVNAETGLQPLVLGYKVEQVPISWINRTPGMGVSSFRLANVGGGYWKVLVGLWLRRVFGIGPYRSLSRHHPVMEIRSEAIAADQAGAR
jgi:dolichol-phosphate mannosyltransferase